MLSLAWIIKTHLHKNSVFNLPCIRQPRIACLGHQDRDLSEKKGAKIDSVKSEIRSWGDGKVLALQR